MSIAVHEDVRMAGRVQRYHTWPHVREQSVGEHSWQLLRILLSICVPLPHSLVVHATLHDVGEVRCGDVPYPTKTDNPVLRKEMERIEHAAATEMAAFWLLPPPPVLDERERWIFKLAEFIEMWEWGLEEELLGNRMAALVSSRCLDQVRQRIGGPMNVVVCEDPVMEAVRVRATDYVARRRHVWSLAETRR